MFAAFICLCDTLAIHIPPSLVRRSCCFWDADYGMRRCSFRSLSRQMAGVSQTHTAARTCTRRTRSHLPETASAAADRLGGWAVIGAGSRALARPGSPLDPVWLLCR